MRAHFILYVADQARSVKFSADVRQLEATLDVPGMSEFELGADTVLGLMPEAGAARLLGLETSGRTPRAEVYLVVASPEEYHARAVAAGAKEISPLAERDWGHTAAYSLDPDGHVLAFAKIP